MPHKKQEPIASKESYLKLFNPIENDVLIFPGNDEVSAFQASIFSLLDKADSSLVSTLENLTRVQREKLIAAFLINDMNYICKVLEKAILKDIPNSKSQIIKKMTECEEDILESKMWLNKVSNKMIEKLLQKKEQAEKKLILTKAIRRIDDRILNPWIKTDITYSIDPHTAQANMDVSHDENPTLLKWQKSSGNITPKEFFSAIKSNNLNYSDFTLLVLGIIQDRCESQKKLNDPKLNISILEIEGILTKIRKLYVDINYVEINKLINQIIENKNYANLIGNNILNEFKNGMSRIEDTLHPMENYSRQFFENRLAHLFSGQGLILESINRVANKLVGLNVTKTQEALDAILAISDLGASNEFVSSLRKNSKLYAVKDRAVRANPEKDNPHKEEDKAFKLREWEARKRELSRDTIWSQNLGFLSSLAPNYRDELSRIPLRNRLVDINVPDMTRWVDEKNQSVGYSSALRREAVFAGSFSGHALYFIANLMKYMDENLTHPYLQKDINQIINGFLALYLLKGYHGYQEVMDVFAEDHVKEIFAARGVTLNVGFSDNIVRQATNDAQHYAKSLALKRAMHVELLQKKGKLKTPEKTPILDTKNIQGVKGIKRTEVKKSSDDVYQFYRAIRDGDLKGVKRIVNNKITLNEKLKLLNQIDQKNYTPILVAAKEGKNEIVDYLISEGADANQLMNYIPPLHRAINDGKLEEVKNLIEEHKTVEEKVKLVNRLDYSNVSPLQLAVFIGNAEIVKMLCTNGAEVNQSINGWSLLHLAIEGKNKGVIDALLESKSIDVNKKGQQGYTPLHLMANYCFSKNVVASLLKNNADVTIKDDSGKAPIHIAVNKGYQGSLFIQMLVENGKDINVKTTDNKTALYLAAENNDPQLIDFLLSFKIPFTDINEAIQMGIKTFKSAILEVLRQTPEGENLVKNNFLKLIDQSIQKNEFNFNELIAMSEKLNLFTNTVDLENYLLEIIAKDETLLRKIPIRELAPHLENKIKDSKTDLELFKKLFTKEVLLSNDGISYYQSVKVNSIAKDVLNSLVNQFSPKEKFQFICALGIDFNETKNIKSTDRFWHALNKSISKDDNDVIPQLEYDSDDDTDEKPKKTPEKEAEENLTYLINSFIQSENQNITNFIYTYFSYIYDLTKSMEIDFEAQLLTSTSDQEKSLYIFINHYLTELYKKVESKQIDQQAAEKNAFEFYQTVVPKVKSYQATEYLFEQISAKPLGLLENKWNEVIGFTKSHLKQIQSADDLKNFVGLNRICKSICYSFDIKNFDYDFEKQLKSYSQETGLYVLIQSYSTVLSNKLEDKTIDSKKAEDAIFEFFYTVVSQVKSQSYLEYLLAQLNTNQPTFIESQKEHLKKMASDRLNTLSPPKVSNNRFTLFQPAAVAAPTTEQSKNLKDQKTKGVDPHNQ